MGPKDARTPKEEFITGLGTSINLSPKPILTTQITDTAISQSQTMVQPLLFPSTSPSTTSSMSPSTPPSSSSHSQRLSLSPTIPSPATLLPNQGLSTQSFPSPELYERAVALNDVAHICPENLPKKTHFNKERRAKPHLTITVPSNEDLRNLKVILETR